MPKDFWKKETLRQEANRRRSQESVGGPLSKSTKAAIRKRMSTADDPILFFGKHKGSRFSEVPEDYLRWILKTFKGKENLSPRMDGLVKNLKRRFKKKK